MSSSSRRGRGRGRPSGVDDLLDDDDDDDARTRREGVKIDEDVYRFL